MATRTRKKAGSRSARANQEKRPAGRNAKASAAHLRATRKATEFFLSLQTSKTGKALAAMPAGLRTVSFTCTNYPAVLVNISTPVGGILLVPSNSLTLPSGSHFIVWAAQGTAGAAFDVTVSGGTLNQPITGPLPAGGNGGPRILTVP